MGQGSRSSLDFLADAGQQDTVLSLKAQLNEKEVELIELRQQQLHLMEVSREARENLEGALESKEEVIKQLEDALVNREQGLEDAILQHQDLSKVNTKTSEELNRHRGKIRELEQSLEDWKSKVQLVDDQKRSCESDLKRCQAQYEASRKEVESLMSAHQQAIVTFRTTASNELQCATEQAKRSEAESCKLREENSELTSIIKNREKEIRGLMGKQQVLYDQLSNLRKQAVITKGPLSQASESLVDVAKSWSVSMETSMQVSEETIVRELHTQILKLQEKIKSRESYAKKYKEACKMLKAKLEEAEEKLSSQKSAKDTLDREIAEVRQQMARKGEIAEEEVNAVQEAFKKQQNQLRLEIDELNKQSLDKDRLLQSMTLEKESSARKARDLEQKIAQLQKDAEGATSRLLLAEQQAKDTASRVEILDRENQELTRQLEEACRKGNQTERCGQDLQRKVDEKSRRIEKMEREMERADKEICELREMLSEATRKAKQAENQANNNEWRSREAENWLGEYEQRAKSAEARSEEMEKKLKAAEGRCKSAESRALDAERSTMESESRVCGLERRIRETEQALEEATRRWKDAEKQREETENLVRMAETAIKQARVESEAEVAQLRSASEMQRKKELEEMQDLRLEVQKLRLAKARSESRADDLGSALQQKQAALGALKQQIGSESTERTGLERRVRALEETVTVKEQVISELKGKLQEADNHISEAAERFRCEIQRKDVAVLESQRQVQEVEMVMRRLAVRSGLS